MILLSLDIFAVPLGLMVCLILWKEYISIYSSYTI